jgi:hypothetical protein
VVHFAPPQTAALSEAAREAAKRKQALLCEVGAHTVFLH